MLEQILTGTFADGLGSVKKDPNRVDFDPFPWHSFAIWIMTPFFVGIPMELEESAQLDGANRLQVFIRVVLPLSAPGLAATAIFVALLEWNEFLIPIVLGNEATKTLPVFISGFISARTLDWGPMAAASSLAIIPIIIVTILVQRRLISGLSAGALKD